MSYKGSRCGCRLAAWAVTGILLFVGCAPYIPTLTSFRNTDRYEYLPMDMDGDSRIDYVQRLDRRAGWKNAFYLDRNQDGVFEEEVDLSRGDMGGMVHIVFAVDGFPFRLMQQLREEGHFLLFRSVGKMVAPYPSLTGVSWPKILRRPAPGGYEAKYFDKKANRIESESGGHAFPQTNEIIGKVDHARAYVQAKSYAEREMRDRYETAIGLRGDKKRKELFYFLGIDAAGHRIDEGELRSLLLEMDRTIERIFFQYGCRCRLTIVSDHGNNRTVGQYVDLVGPLEEMGFRSMDSLESEEDFVCPRYGMIGIAAIYTDYGNVVPMATRLCQIEGVDFVVYWNPAGVQVVSDKGTATIRWRRKRLRYDVFGIFSSLFAKGREYMYEPVTGDPLDLSTLAKQAWGSDKAGYREEDEWFRATESFRYPDPLRRIADTFEDDVRNPATLLVDIEDRYYSAGKVHLVAHSAGTHGNLGDMSSLGVVGANWRKVPSAVPADKVNGLLNIALGEK